MPAPGAKWTSLYKPFARRARITSSGPIVSVPASAPSPVDDPRERRDPAREREWAERVQQGDVAAFEEIFRAYYRPLCAFAYGFVKSREVAEDVAQMVFTRLWVRREHLKVRDDLRAYLYSATRNQALNTLQHLDARRRLEEGVRAGEDVPAGMGRSGTNIEESLKAEALWQAIARLPERARLVLTLRWEHDLSYEDIAKIMGITPKSAEIAKSRAVNALRKLLPDDLT